MKKKTLLLLVALAVFVAFLAMLPVAYSGADSVTTLQYNLTLADPFADIPGIQLTNEAEALNLLLARQTERSDYAYTGMVFNKNGNLIAKSGNYIKLDNDGEVSFYSLDKYMTTDIKKQFNKIVKKDPTLLHSAHFKLEYNIEDGEMVPVKITLDNNSETRVTIEFSHKDAKFVFPLTDDHTIATIYLSDCDEKHYNHRVFEKMQDKINIDELSEVAIEQLNYKYSGSGSISNSEYANYYGDIIINGETYYYFEFTARNKFLENITSENFRNSAIEGSFFFVLLGAVILIAVSKLYDKNELIKKSRMAFISAAAHELKTPIAIISNQCELVLENIAPEKNIEYISSVYDEALRMNSLVSTLLQYNKLNSIESISKEYTDIDEIVKTELTKYEPMFIEKNLHIVTDCEKQTIRCNKELIALAVDNFISNAIKHTPSTGTIEVKVKNSKVCVYNQGPHIDQKDAAHIWEDFYKEDKSRQRSDNSTGMGLAICKRIFELHGFRYGFKNRENGVEFEFGIK